MLSLATGPLNRKMGFLLQTAQDQGPNKQHWSRENYPMCGSSFLNPILCEIVRLWFSPMRGVSCSMFFWKGCFCWRCVNVSAKLASWWYGHVWSNLFPWVIFSFKKPLCSALGWGAIFPQWPLALGLQAFCQPRHQAWVLTLPAQPSPSASRGPSRSLPCPRNQQLASNPFPWTSSGRSVV